MFQLKSLKHNLLYKCQHEGKRQGIIFCFGNSLISKIISLKTRRDANDIVPTHVALCYGDFVYESTTSRSTIGKKSIDTGVRRILLTDFLKKEKGRRTTYEIFPHHLNKELLEEYVHYPYGLDSLVDFFFTSGSDGVSYGLICSQYVNLVASICDEDCPSPADLYYKIMEDTHE